MAPRHTSFARAGRILLVLVLFAALVSTAGALNNGQKASVVLGQPDFTSNATLGATASTMSNPAGVAVDPTSGKVFVADQGNNRVLRFASGAALLNGAAAEIVLGQATFTANV